MKAMQAGQGTALLLHLAELQSLEKEAEAE